MDKDIQEMFRSKNREILIKNLKYDLDKNVNSLLDTITNIYNLEFDTAIKNILAILGDSNIEDAEKFVTDNINAIKLSSYNAVESLINNKKAILGDKIDALEFKEDQMTDYYDMVFETTKQFKIKMKNSINDILTDVDNKFEKYIIEVVYDEQKELACGRVADYLKNRLYGKLETKVHMEIMLRDNNLINKAKEGYLRFQEITSKTLKN